MTAEIATYRIVLALALLVNKSLKIYQASDVYGDTFYYIGNPNTQAYQQWYYFKAGEKYEDDNALFAHNLFSYLQVQGFLNCTIIGHSYYQATGEFYPAWTETFYSVSEAGKQYLEAHR